MTARQDPVTRAHLAADGRLEMTSGDWTSVTHHASPTAAREAAIAEMVTRAGSCGRALELLTSGVEGAWRLSVAADGSVVPVAATPSEAAPECSTVVLSSAQDDSPFGPSTMSDASSTPSVHGSHAGAPSDSPLPRRAAPHAESVSGDAPAAAGDAPPVVPASSAPAAGPLPTDDQPPMLPPMPGAVHTQPKSCTGAVGLPTDPSDDPTEQALPEVPSGGSAALSVELERTRLQTHRSALDLGELGDTLLAPRFRLRREHRAKLYTSNGSVLEVSGNGVLGRRPHGWKDAVVFEDREHSVSNCHLRFEVVADGLLIVDLESSNGTLITADGTEQVCEPGVEMRAPRGSRVDIGSAFFVVV